MRIVLGITGASGIQYGIAVLRLLAKTDVDAHVILTQSARRVMNIETDFTVEDVEVAADVLHHPNDIAAAIASGSFEFDGMLVCPCSMKTLGYIANGIAEGLIPRVADVCLKEGRDLMLVPRESPMAQTHLDNLQQAGAAGAIIAPAAPGFYTNSESIDDLVETFAARLLDRLGIETSQTERWTGPPGAEKQY